MYLGGTNLLILYSNHTARLWDVKTKEFWRSMSREKAEELITQGGWLDL
jgi:WD repeat-containing protein 7